MIDDEKIDMEAFNLYKNDKLDFVSSESVEGFKAGAHWAIKEFLKSLWHDASEVPQRANTELLIEATFEGFNGEPVVHHCIDYSPPRDMYSKDATEVWHTRVKERDVLRWLYVDDLLYCRKEVSNERV